MSRAEAEDFLANPVVIEEKVDGANLGISFDSQGNLLAQNRGNLLVRGSGGQFAPLWAWLIVHETRLFDVLEDRFMIFGEWCYARHSIHYDQLPDLFLAFDIFDKRSRRFISSHRRNELLDLLGLVAVPWICSGLFSLGEIPMVITQSFLYDGPMEGVYLRQEDENWLIQRAKVVRSEFVQNIGEHWSKQRLTPNQIHT
jgi:ATP-dependent RNA circularization protein (DNA/RNA ligase family)